MYNVFSSNTKGSYENLYKWIKNYKKLIIQITIY